MALVGTSELSFDKAAWEKMAFFALRPELFFDQWATVKPSNTTTPGSTVNFQFVDELAEATTPLDEYTDVTPVTMGDTFTQVTTAEYGNAVKRTRFIKEHSFIPLDPVVANVIGYNAGVSIDSIVRDVLHSDTAAANIYYSGAEDARADLIPGDELTAADIRRAVARLRGRNVPTFGGFYAASIHPDTSVDLREETGAAAWRDPQVYGNSQMKIWNGEIGVFEKVRFIESPRAKVFAGAGAGSSAADVYATLVVGPQFLAKAFASGVGPRPNIVPGPITDTLRRFVPMGWYWLGGYGLFRKTCGVRIESGSSLDTGYAA